MHLVRHRLMAGLLLMLPVVAAAQVVPVEDFARHAEVQEVALSPDGRHVAMTVPADDGNESQLLIVALDGSGKTQVLRFGKRQHVTDIVWTSPTRVVVSRANMEPMKAQLFSQGELVASDIDGKHQGILFAYIPDDGFMGGRRKDMGYAQIDDLVEREPGVAMVNFTAWRTRPDDEYQPTTIFRVDTVTGDRKQVEYSPEAAGFYFDSKSRARLRVVNRPGMEAPDLFYRPRPNDQDWTPVPATLAGRRMSLAYVADDDDTAYALITDKGEPEQLFRISLSAGTRTRVVGRDDIEIAGLMYSGHGGAPFGVYYDAATPTVEYLDPSSEWARLHASLMKSFPGELVSMSDYSQDNNKVLFTVFSDRNPGAYYVFDRQAGKIQLINEAEPWIKRERMAPVAPITFKTRDGVTLHGFYTAPVGAKGPQPLIVMPHGGPHGVYDSWSYDNDVQFLASRGYAVLQVNFRGSAGRGDLFTYSGYQQWGGRMMDDIADGVRWAIDNKRADPGRICTYGASFGGYAALMNPIRYPDLYRCAIGSIGVYDLALMKKFGDVRGTGAGRDYLDQALGTDQAALAANSPARNADKIKVPVMLFQGSVDKRVPMEQFDAMVTGFRKAGVQVDTMVVKGEGHGFYKPENRVEVYRRIEAFLARNLGPDAGVTASANAK
ncbi:LpqB family beta-propeller domain-containing protein [Lysobacter sp. S4-A87]|uniref:alpha/beta hydrolase family protein n=1 Tax=Lysobacter sp. S4-A87 TaxID=2925843 RepID=UPI001F5396B1|nr:prolyl oligopeptidase family serine peptidase [Lysobacter sp. S4-A87]UNK49312.1 LpqB family beta-propeller domain-containing protein [Lysobacter sp. S4-A87]